MANKAAQKLGKRGGQKTASLYGKEHFKRIAKGWPKGKPRKKKEDDAIQKSDNTNQ